MQGWLVLSNICLKAYFYCEKITKRGAPVKSREASSPDEVRKTPHYLASGASISCKIVLMCVWYV